MEGSFEAVGHTKRRLYHMQIEQLCKDLETLEASFLLGHADTSIQLETRFKVGRAQRPGKEVPGHVWPSRS